MSKEYEGCELLKFEPIADFTSIQFEAQKAIDELDENAKKKQKYAYFVYTEFLGKELAVRVTNPYYEGEK